MIYLHQIIRDWFIVNRAVGRYESWIYDDGMIWKPYHRYWFIINDDNVVAHDKGVMYYTTGKAGDLKTVLEAADPYFLEKLDKMLINYA